MKEQKTDWSDTFMEYKIIPLTITMPFGNIENTIHPTLLLEGESVVLIDCGFIGALSIIEKELLKHGLLAKQVTDIVLTHHDHDHMGAAAEFKRLNPNIKIHASAKEASYITAEEKPLRLHQAEEMQKLLPVDERAFGEAFCEMLRRLEPVQVDSLIYDGDILPWCGGCKVIETPGHTPGHISLIIIRDNIIITGDAIALEESMPVIANPQFTLDIDEATKSMEKLLSMKANIYYCYHGGVYTLTNEDK